MSSTSSPSAQECSFQLRNGLVLTAKFWRAGASSAQARPCRRFLAFHGHLDNASSFDKLAPLMIQQLGPEPVEVLCLDFAGHGTSSHRQSEDYSLWRYVEDVDQVVEQLGWQRHAIVAHSMGASVATLYAGLFESRVLLCIVMDNFGPFVHPAENEPELLAESIEKSKKLVHKKPNFYPTVEAACESRTQGGIHGLELESARFLVPRGLRRTEGADEHGNIVPGWTWSADQMLRIRSGQSVSVEYVRAFMSRIMCPVLGVMATGGLSSSRDFVDERIGWMHKAKVTIKDIEGSHSAHMDDAPAMAELVCSWVLAQDAGEVARL